VPVIIVFIEIIFYSPCLQNRNVNKSLLTLTHLS
jgi:hypothetical protein